MLGLEQFPEDAVQGAWVNEGDVAVGAGSRLAVDELGLHGRQRIEGGGQVISPEADVVKALAAGGEESRDARLAVEWLDELDAGGRVGAGRQKGETNQLQREIRCRLVGIEAEELAVAWERLVH